MSFAAMVKSLPFEMEARIESFARSRVKPEHRPCRLAPIPAATPAPTPVPVPGTLPASVIAAVALVLLVPAAAGAAHGSLPSDLFVVLYMVDLEASARVSCVPTKSCRGSWRARRQACVVERKSSAD